MPLLTHDETGAASVARARAVAVAERPAPGGPVPPPPAAGKQKKQRTTWQKVRRWLWIVLVLLVVGPLIAFVIGWMIFKVPSVDDTAVVQTATYTFSDGPPLAVVRPTTPDGTNINRSIVTLDKVPQPVRQAVLAAEDRSFYSNPGFDITGIGRAIFNQLTGGVGGGSTITQQYVKNATGQDQATLWRKYKEVVISVKISKEQTKDQILENYLNTIYFGRGAYGIQAASRAYFDKDVGQLTVAEGAMLAGTIQSPSNTDIGRTKARWTYVLDQMVQAGTLTPAARTQQSFPTAIPAAATSGGLPGDDRYHIYQRAQKELLAQGITADQINTEGLTITTTVDGRRQKELVDAVNATMAKQPGDLRAAAVSIDPRTGEVVAYYGGSNGVGQDYAGDTERQPGSAFKPFVLSAALQSGQGIGLGTVYDGTSGQILAGRKVNNSDGESCARCTVKTAMTQSINTVFYKMGIDVGPSKVIDAAHQAGIPAGSLGGQADGGIALGDQEVHPVDMASAYGTFAADGVHRDPYIVKKVVAADGRVLLDRTGPPAAGTRSMSQQVARNITESMIDVASSSSISLRDGRPVAAKTGTVQLGTTNDNKDTWTVGYTPSLSTAVWVGTDKSDPVRTKAGRPAYGRTIAGLIWRDFMSSALKGVPEEQFSNFDPLGTPIAPPAATFSETPTPDPQSGTDSGNNGNSGNGNSGNGTSDNGNSGNGNSGNGNSGNGNSGNGAAGVADPTAPAVAVLLARQQARNGQGAKKPRGGSGG